MHFYLTVNKTAVSASYIDVLSTFNAMNKRTVHLVLTISQLYLLHLLALLVQAVRAKTEEITDCNEEVSIM